MSIATTSTASGNRPNTGPGRRCAFVGDELLVAQCAEIARDAGLDVVVIATEHPQVREYAEQHDIAHVRSAERLDESLSAHPYDVLLSVANLRVLPDSILERATTAINFHDGPLPGYAGLNVTTWALLHGETEHAITWHMMTNDVDGGHVVALERFPIGADDTAFSLNARCYEAALSSFPSIVDQIVDGTLSTEAQPDGERRVFRRYERPIVVFDADQDAASFVRATRAVALGHRMRNTMGAAHLVVGSGQVVADEVAFEAGSGTAPGTVVAVEPTLRIATVDGDVVISACSTTSGVQLSTSEAATYLGLVVGQVFEGPPSGLIDRFRDVDTDLARREQAWRERLAAVEIVTPSLFDAYPNDNADHQVSITLPGGLAANQVVAAIAAWNWRVTRNEHSVFHVSTQHDRDRVSALAPLLENPLAVFAVDATTTFDDLVARADIELDADSALGPFLKDLVGRDPDLHGRSMEAPIRLELHDDAGPSAPADTASTALLISLEQGTGELTLRSSVVGALGLERIASQLEAVLVGGLAAPETPISALRVVGDEESAALDAINATDMDYDNSATIDALFDAQAERTPEAPALSSGSRTLTYRELHDASTAFAGRLQAAGVASGDSVGIAVNRGIDMVIAVLATHQCGAAYVPLDPTYPADRLAFMISDSGLRTVVAEPGATVLDDAPGVTVVHPGADSHDPADPQATHDTDHTTAHTADDLAYVIYTSGSTGTPKGVMLEHRNVVNFFGAMDEVIEHDPPGVWLALTSLSFDISVLELLWTFTRGFHVVLKADSGLKGARASATRHGPRRPVSMSMFYFAAGEEQAGDGYRLLLESARFADRHGFEAVWTPERHFHAFGGSYPNPSVTGAALAAITEHVHIRAGSVVAPLHSPARIAEEWSVVDNLSKGRVGISFAAGWQPNDFVLNPGAYANAKESLPGIIDTVERLWRGETVEMPGHDGQPVAVRTLPRPVQATLPVWLTSAGSPATFERAGTLGVNVLTHLLGQTIEQLTENIGRYRSAWTAAGHEGEGRVTLMLHTYLDRDTETAKQTAHDPMKGYLSTAVGLLKNMASSFPTLGGGGKDADEAFKSLTSEEMDQLLEMAATRYLETSGLFGTTDGAVDLIEECSDAGADEIACLIDFGVDTDLVLNSLGLLAEVKERLDVARVVGADDEGGLDELAPDASFAELAARYGPTHVQCTPSLATMLLADPADRRALTDVRHLMLGGEALPTAMASELTELLTGRLTNMYGPTETTIWSLVHELDSVPTGSVPIGKPIGNNTVFVLDEQGGRAPVGVFGELHIGGDGVARGYHDRPELTKDRFVERGSHGVLYATGDVVRIRTDGVVEFAGRADHQVKIRGHRIELGEIESVLDTHPDIVQSVVVAQPSTAGDPLLVAFVLTRDHVELDDASARALVAASLPEAMVPSRFIRLDALPLTPNGKIDRTTLLADVDTYRDAASAPAVELDDDTEQLVADIWSAELRRGVGRDDNFFEIGGNSLLAVSVFRKITTASGASLALTDVFRYPTIRSFAAHLSAATGQGNGDGADDSNVQAEAPSGLDRGARRRRAMARRSGN